MSLFGGVNYISNHGSSQGIIPRFFLHFEEMSKSAFFGNKEREVTYLNYETKNREHFTNFYDTYHEILDLRKEYVDGINSGLYFSVLPDGRTTSNVIPEIKIRKRIKEFFISGKQLLNDFCKSELLDDGDFKLKLFLFKDNNGIEAYLKNTSNNFRYKNGYSYIVNIAKIAQNNFKEDFLQLRNALEHDYNTSIQPFQMIVEDSNIQIIEPSFKGNNIFQLIDYYYNSTLDFIEDTAAYFFGINSCTKSDGKITLFKRKDDINPAEFRYRYTITLDVGDPDLQRTIKPIKK